MNDKQVERKIALYIQYIENDSQTKIKEIESKIEEECNLEKGLHLQNQCLSILNHYSTKEKNLDLQLKLQASQLKSNAKIAILSSKEHSINEILKEVGQKLKKKNKDVEAYKEILTKLILQAMLSLLDKKVFIEVLREDKDLIKDLVPDAEKQYNEITGLNVKGVVNTKSFLPEQRLGGVEVYGSTGLIKVCNTFESRIELLREKVLPYIRFMLYGPNKNRRFMD